MHLETLRKVVAAGEFVVLDTETTSLNGEIVQIGILDNSSRIILNRLIRPSVEIGPEAEAIHGISNSLVANEPTFADLLDLIRPALSVAPVLSYNAVFDRKMLHHSAEAWGLEKIDWKTIQPWVCVMEAFAEWYGEWNDYRQSYRWQSLTKAASSAGIAIAGHHGAIDDCRITLGVIHFLCAQRYCAKRKL
jgi:DNA polymerase-3 subunit epsilon